MKKNIIIIVSLLCIAIALVAVFFYISYFKHGSLRPSSVSNNQIEALLKTNPDAKEYMQSHADFMIQDKIILTKENILQGQQGQNFKDVYEGLALQDNRYMKVDLINQAGDQGLIAVIDFQTQTTPKAYGLLLFKASANLHGQATSQTAN